MQRMIESPATPEGFLSGSAAEKVLADLARRHAKNIAPHLDFLREHGLELRSDPLDGIRFRRFDVDDDRLIPRPNTTVPGNLDRQTGLIWDTLTVGPNLPFPTTTTMFSVPLQGNTKLQAGTNLQGSGGMLPFPQMMDVSSLRLFILNSATATDILTLYTNVWFQVYVNSFSKFEGLGWHIPAAGGLWIFGNQVGTPPAGSAVMFSASNGVPDAKNCFTLGDIIHIGAGELFSVVVNATTPFNTQPNTTNPPGTGLTLVFAFEGDRYKPLGG